MASTPRSAAAQRAGRAAEGCANGLLHRDVSAGLANSEDAVAAAAEDAAAEGLLSDGQALQLVAAGSGSQQQQAAAAQAAVRRQSGAAASTSSAPADGVSLPQCLAYMPCRV